MSILAQSSNSNSVPQKAFIECTGSAPTRVCKYGFKDSNGVVVIAPQFEYARDFSEEMALIMIKGQYGYIDTKGQIVIPNQFVHAEDFSEGLAAVQVNSKWGFIDRNGKMIISPQYDLVGRFSEGLAMVHSENERPPSGYIDKTGKLLLKNKEAEHNFSEGLVPIAARRFGLKWWVKYGYIDKTGKFVIKPRFDEAEPFINGRARVAKGCGPLQLNEMSACKWFYIDRKGKVIKEEKPKSALSPTP